MVWLSDMHIGSKLNIDVYPKEEKIHMTHEMCDTYAGRRSEKKKEEEITNEKQ